MFRLYSPTKNSKLPFHKNSPTALIRPRLRSLEGQKWLRNTETSVFACYAGYKYYNLGYANCKGYIKIYKMGLKGGLRSIIAGIANSKNSTRYSLLYLVRGWKLPKKIWLHNFAKTASEGEAWYPCQKAKAEGIDSNFGTLLIIFLINRLSYNL